MDNFDWASLPLETYDALKKSAKDRVNLYTVITVVCFLSGIGFVVMPFVAGLAIFSINNYNNIRTYGVETKGGVGWWILLFMSFIIIGIIVVQFLGRSSLGHKVLGWDKIL